MSYLKKRRIQKRKYNLTHIKVTNGRQIIIPQRTSTIQHENRRIVPNNTQNIQKQNTQKQNTQKQNTQKQNTQKQNTQNTQNTRNMQKQTRSRNNQI